MRSIGHYFFSISYLAIVKYSLVVVWLLAGLAGVAGRIAASGGMDAASGDIIPEDAIRIRMIANSDSEADQAIKNRLRDDVAAYISTWGPMPAAREEARSLIVSRLSGVNTLVAAKLQEYGASYGGEAELGRVPFPEKMFRGILYAAGDYEALRITLGEGTGANWWCVLFPPLCLTAAVASDEASAAGIADQGVQDNDESAGQDQDADKPKTKFFLVELFQKLWAFLSSLF